MVQHEKHISEEEYFKNVECELSNVSKICSNIEKHTATKLCTWISKVVQQNKKIDGTVLYPLICMTVNSAVFEYDEFYISANWNFELEYAKNKIWSGDRLFSAVSIFTSSKSEIIYFSFTTSNSKRSLINISHGTCITGKSRISLADRDIKTKIINSKIDAALEQNEERFSALLKSFTLLVDGLNMTSCGLGGPGSLI